MVIDELYTNVVVEEMDTRSITETIEVEGLIVKIVMIHEADSQVARVVEVDDRLDWVDGIAEVDNGLD